MLRRVPLESSEPVLAFAWARVALVLAGLVSSVFAGFPFEGELALLLGGVALPWALATVVMARRRPELAFGPVTPTVDIALLVLIEALVPETYAATRFIALLLFSVHAHLQGEARGVLVASAGSASLVAVATLTDGPVHGGLLGFYESIFVVAAIGSAVLLGRMRTTESTGRLRARELTRRTLGSEAEVRRQLAESLHDGPVQELIGVDMMLTAARQANEAGDRKRADEVLGEARALVERNIQHLRDEIVALGPEAFEELSFEEAMRTCLPVWQRRYGIEVELDIEELALSSAMAGDLFRIAQEAVTNAGRHARAEAISVHLRRANGNVELRVCDDGEGFGEGNLLERSAPGHLGLAAMRERAALLYGELRVESSEAGTNVIVRAPLAG
ncbi:MAG: ATP-binding protein [Thermoleophilaceae bacterium]